MDYDSPQFIAAVKKVLQDSLAHLAKSFENLKDAVSARWKADEEAKKTDQPITTTNLRTDVPIRVQTEPKPGKIKATGRFLKGALEAIGIFAVIIYTYLAYNQWQELDISNINQSAANISSGATADRALYDTRILVKAAQDQAAAAKTSAETAAKSLKAIQDQTRLEQRAWVGVQGYSCNCKIVPIPPKERFTPTDETVVYDVSGTFVNTGKTPALRVRIQIGSTEELKKNPIPTWEDFEKSEQAAKQANSYSYSAWELRNETAEIVIAPNAPYQWEHPKTETTRTLTIPSDTRVIYVLGKVTYYDVFLAKQHTTTFCLMNDFGATFHFCPTGNRMD